MALNFLTSNPDYVQRTAADSRKITKTLVGDFTFDLFTDQYRHKVFLTRNMTKVLAFHDRNRIRGLETGTLRSSSRTRGPFLGNGTPAAKVRVTSDVANGITNGVNDQSNDIDAFKSQDTSGAIPDVESMSQDCLKVKAQHGSIGEQAREKRRSVRHQMTRQHEDKNAQLYLDLVSIRKKLNFKDSISDNDNRPKKRVRRENTPCHCHVTIWDNRQGPDQKEPLVRKSEYCEVSTSDLGSAGYLAEVKLAKPFVFKSSDLNIPLNASGGTVLGVGDNYFLEIKIIPNRDDAEWPPVPILGRSEGDQTTGLGRAAAERLERSLVAKYKGLPHAPAADVPLSIFYLHNQSTYRSKYGLEVNAMWTKGEVPEVMLKREEGEETPLNLWALDEEGRSFGRRDGTKSKEELTEPTLKPRAKESQASSSPMKVVFSLDAGSAKGAKDFRRSTTIGLRCPTCANQSFKTVEDLQFHFTNVHSKYKLTVEKTDYSPATDELTSVVFKVSAVGTARPRNQDREPGKNDKDIKWQAPKDPLDVPAYVNGDQSWVDQNWVEGPPKKPDPVAAAITVVPDPISSVRQTKHSGFAPAQKGGFLPAEQVSQFRESARKKFANIKLKTMTTDKEIMYTSISHRQVHVGEEARSESDDEMEDGWFVKKSLEALDIAAEKQGWTDEQRLLRRKWNQARLGERLGHPRYLSDCLIRFVRSEKSWLQAGGQQRKATFAEFVDEFLQRRVINQEVIRDLWTILHVDQDTKPDSDPHFKEIRIGDAKLGTKAPVMFRKIQNLTPRQQKAEMMLNLPLYTCAMCIKPVEDTRRQGVHCSDHDCEAPGIWYHNKCVRCKRKDKLNWKCEFCIDRLEEAKRAKGKEVAVD